ncbi:MAG: hypothetical protein IJD22_05335 [Clostridia bacterium]|nr:hypothetical protein [Clostridia bacterium]
MYESLKKLNKDKLWTVFNAALERKNTTRTVIAEDTGLSFVTAGKIADALVECGIMKQSYSNKSALVKKHARLLSAKFLYWTGVYLITPQRFFFYICDLSFRVINTFSIKPEDSIFTDDVLRAFLKRTDKFIAKHAKTDKCCGIGILLPDEYDESSDKTVTSSLPHLKAVKIKKLFSGFTYSENIIVRTYYTSFSQEIHRSLDTNEQAYSLFLNKGCIKATYISGNYRESYTEMDLGGIKSSGGKSFSRLCRSAPDPTVFFPALSDTLRTLILTVPIKRIIVSGNLYSSIDAVKDVLTNYLSESCADYSVVIPKIISADLYALSVRSISREIRNSWFLGIIS